MYANLHNYRSLIQTQITLPGTSLKGYHFPQSLNHFPFVLFIASSRAANQLKLFEISSEVHLLLGCLHKHGWDFEQKSIKVVQILNLCNLGQTT
jgi:hypothetical protein